MKWIAFWGRTHTWRKKSNVVNPPIITSLRKSSFPRASTMVFLLFFVGLLPVRFFGVLLRIWFIFSICYMFWEVFRSLKCSVVQLHFGPKYISDIICLSHFLATPPNYLIHLALIHQISEMPFQIDWQAVLAQNCVVMDSSSNYLYWLIDFLLAPTIAFYTPCSQRQKLKIHLQIADTDHQCVLTHHGVVMGFGNNYLS